MAGRSRQPILVGEVIRPHGLRGEVAVSPQSENPTRFAPGSQLQVGISPGSATTRRVLSSRPTKSGLLVGFEGIIDRDQAEALRGHLVFVDVSDVPNADAGSWWEHELVGAEVYKQDGELIGRISGILSRFEQDIWEIETDVGSVQFPAAKDLVLSVDLDKRRITVAIPEGLLDDEI